MISSFGYFFGAAVFCAAPSVGDIVDQIFFATTIAVKMDTPAIFRDLKKRDILTFYGHWAPPKGTFSMICSHAID
jgi:hypothetical protein